jgi:hypothetical protein
MLIVIFYQNKNVEKTFFFSNTLQNCWKNTFQFSNTKVIFFGLCLYINKRQTMCDEVEEKSKIYKMIPMFSKKIMCIFKI